MARLRPGELTERVMLQRAADTPDGQGGATRTWATYATVWARVRQVTASERNEAGQLLPVTRLEVLIRRGVTVRPQDRLVRTGMTYPLAGRPNDASDYDDGLVLVCEGDGTVYRVVASAGTTAQRQASIGSGKQIFRAATADAAQRQTTDGVGLVSTAPPDGFSWTPPFHVFAGPGRLAQTDYDPEDMLPAGWASYTTYYVDVATGSDANPGTQAQPFKTITHAVHNRAANILVYVKPGLYDRDNCWKSAIAGTLAGNYNVVVRRWGDSGRIVSSMRYSGLTWSLESGSTWKATVAGDVRVVDAKATQVYATGIYKRLVAQTSIANVEANPGSYFRTGTTVYVRTGDSRQPDADILVFQADLNNGRFDGGVLWIEYMDFEGGSHPFSISRDSAVPQWYARECTFRYGAQATGGARMVGGSRAILYRCDADANQLDGFKWEQSASGFKPDVAELFCNARHNGHTTSNAANGSSAHDGVRSIRLGDGTTIYSDNRGRNIHDITNAESWLVGMRAGPSNSGSTADAMAAFAAGTGTGDASRMWLDRCTSLSSVDDVDVAQDATIHLRDFVRTANGDAGTGTVTTY